MILRDLGFSQRKFYTMKINKFLKYYAFVYK